MNNITQKPFEEEVEIELRMDQATINKYKDRLKKDILNSLFISILRNRIQDETIEELQERIEILERHASGLQDIVKQKDKSLKQAKEMIKASTYGW